MEIWSALGLVVNFLVSMSAYLPGGRDNQEVAVIMFNATLNQYSFVQSGERFYDDVLEWTEEQKTEFAERALIFFETKFGLTDPHHNPKLNIMLYSTNRNAGMRCFVLEGVVVPNEGYQVLDGGWMITVSDPQGIDLGGEFVGTHAPMGTTFTIGQWYIDRSNAPGSSAQTALTWDFQHAAPGIIATIGTGRTSNGEIDVISEKYGAGKSFHIAKYSFDGRGNAHAIFRNVITFT